MNAPKFDKEAPTIPAPPPEPKIPDTVTEDPINNDIQKVQKGVRYPLIISLGWALGILGAGGSVGYYYIEKMEPFAPHKTMHVTPSASTPQNEEPPVPDKIRTSKDLKESMAYAKITVSPEDFGKDPSKYYFKVLVLNPILDYPEAPPSHEFKYTWEPANNKGKKITHIEENETIIALRLENPDLQKKLRFAGLHPRVTLTDEKDPLIRYVYYNCEDKPNEELLAEIAVQDPYTPRKRNLTYRSFYIKPCEKKESDVQSDAQTQ